MTGKAGRARERTGGSRPDSKAFLRRLPRTILPAVFMLSGGNGRCSSAMDTVTAEGC